ncbi:hypothetical protein [Candidatus Solincola tengchongensis]|uniref:hypothetical protein n=1 Tax=Candidatus Solincola tengchongensis TaxID=2900693 RepID=UPI00257DBAA4|nr:hypothetical protein [Candidatus Solincola tengchongensis]
MGMRPRGWRGSGTWPWRMALAAALLVVMAILWAGCGGKGSPATEEPALGEVGPEAAEEEDMTATDSGTDALEGGEAFTHITEGGEVAYQVSREAPAEEELGVPLYPGAAYVAGSGGSVSGSSSEGAFTTIGGEYRTKDPFGSVFQWYRERLGEPLVYRPEQDMATWNRAEEGRMVVVGLRREGGETAILIYSLKGDAEIFTP